MCQYIVFVIITLFNDRYVGAAVAQFQTAAEWVTFASTLMVGLTDVAA